VSLIFATGIIVQDLAWFITSGLVTAAQGTIVIENHKKLIKATVPHIKGLVQAFDIKEHMIYAPIGKDWVAYNVHDNQGELLQARL
jgi:uncharacterized protein (DUF697 family)